jgi:hypothetical protein
MQTGREIGMMLTGSNVNSPMDWGHLATGPGRPAAGCTKREQGRIGDRACLAALQLCPLKTPPGGHGRTHATGKPTSAQEVQTRAVAAPLPDLPFHGTRQPRCRGCWDEAAHESPSHHRQGSRKGRQHSPATSESPSAARSRRPRRPRRPRLGRSISSRFSHPFSRCMLGQSVCLGSPPHQTTLRRPLAMACPSGLRQTPELPQVRDHRCWAASSLGSIANRPGEPGTRLDPASLLSLADSEPSGACRQTNIRRDGAHNSEIGSDTKLLLFSPVESEHVSDPTSVLGVRWKLAVGTASARVGPDGRIRACGTASVDGSRTPCEPQARLLGGRILETGNGTPRAVSLHPGRRQRATADHLRTTHCPSASGANAAKDH